MRRPLLLALFPVGAALLLACPASLDDRCADGACDPRGDGGTPSVSEPAGCIYGASPAESPACIDDAFAVFVAPTGDNAAAGTKAAPLRTIDAAVGRSVETGKPHIYVCSGDYTSSVTITRKLSIFGVACDFASPAGAARPRWTGASSAFTAQIAAVPERVVLADLEIVAPDAPVDADGQSSIGVFVTDAADVRLLRVDVKAGRGSKGKGATEKARATPAPKGGPGTDGAGTDGGVGAKNTCPDGDSVGGSGGSTKGPVGPTPGAPKVDAGGAPGTSGDPCNGAGVGKPGDRGGEGEDAPKPTSLGTLARSGWAPAAGAKGKDGARAQGGGGGAFYFVGGVAGGTGGGGGAGGCGGAGGGGGSGGGASVALLVSSSNVDVSLSRLSGGAGGDGGGGAPGQLGQAGGGGGGGGRHPSEPDGCSGGMGGDGGRGGDGTGGAAGVARALLFTASTIVSSETTLAGGTPGSPGAGGAPGVNDGVAAAPGESQEL